MKKVIICGLGAVGLTYAARLNSKSELFVLVDRERLKKYKENKPVFNGMEQEFNYILPDIGFPVDVIIIATKSYDLDSAIENIKNFVTEKTIIISLLNGISSELKIKTAYPQATVLKSYFIGHSAIRFGNSVMQDGVGEIVVEENSEMKEFLEECEIDYSMPKDIDYSMWLKFTMNIFSNQVSAILNMKFGELKQNQAFIEFAKKLINEVREIAEKKGIKNLENLEKDALDSLQKMSNSGKTSMLQDILAGRKTEVDIFAGEIIKLGKEYNVKTPYNQVLYDLIKIKEEK